MIVYISCLEVISARGGAVRGRGVQCKQTKQNSTTQYTYNIYTRRTLAEVLHRLRCVRYTLSNLHPWIYNHSFICTKRVYFAAIMIEEKSNKYFPWHPFSLTCHKHIAHVGMLSFFKYSFKIALFLSLPD